MSVSLVSALGAGDRLDLGITPIKKEISIAPGGVATGSVTMYNNSDISYPATMESEDCTSSNTYGTPTCLAHSGSGDPLHLSTWITFASTGAFVIPPHGNKTINYMVRAPQGVQPGGYYAGIIFRNMDPPTTGGTIGMRRQMQSLLLVTITGQMIVAPEFGTIELTGPGG
jgi:hypothetical protein